MVDTDGSWYSNVKATYELHQAPRITEYLGFLVTNNYDDKSQNGSLLVTSLHKHEKVIFQHVQSKTASIMSIGLYIF